MRTFAVIGTGAVGGYYGAVLARAGHTVHFLARSDADHMAQHGLCVKSFKGDFTIEHPLVHATTQTIPPCDAVIVATKTTANSDIIPFVTNLLKPDGALLLFQNGFGEEDRFFAATGIEQIFSGICFIGAEKIAPGVIEHQASGGIRLGQFAKKYQAAGITPLLTSLTNELRAAQLSVDMEEDWVLARFRKLVWNIPFNGLSVVLHTDTQKLVHNPHTRALVRRLMDEVAQGAASLGRMIEPAFIEQMITYTEGMPVYLPSMRHDYDAKRAMEVQSMYCTPLDVWHTHGAELPAITLLAEQLAFIMTSELGLSL